MVCGINCAAPGVRCHMNTGTVKKNRCYSNRHGPGFRSTLPYYYQHLFARARRDTGQTGGAQIPASSCNIFRYKRYHCLPTNAAMPACRKVLRLPHVSHKGSLGLVWPTGHDAENALVGSTRPPRAAQLRCMGSSPAPGCRQGSSPACACVAFCSNTSCPHRLHHICIILYIG